MMRYIDSGRTKMTIKESVSKKQGMIDSGRDVLWWVLPNIGLTRTTGTTATENETETRGGEVFGVRP